jgi:hypothetical protein
VDAVKALREALKNNMTLTSLDLWGNAVPDEEMALIETYLERNLALAAAPGKSLLDAKTSLSFFHASSTMQDQKTRVSVKKLLLYVAEGEQDKAEAILKDEPLLALRYGSVRDKSDRKFNHITAFQYAVWALDWHMWEMMLRQFNSDEHRKLAAEQYQELDAKGTEHGKMFSLDPLIQALQKYSDKFDGWTDEQRENYWFKEVGRLQRQLPWHVVNEYCRPDWSFYPCPSFTEQKPLPRGKGREKEWMESETDKFLGINMAWARGTKNYAPSISFIDFLRGYETIMMNYGDPVVCRSLSIRSRQISKTEVRASEDIRKDKETLTQMSKARVHQREELGNTVKARATPSNKPRGLSSLQ